MTNLTNTISSRLRMPSAGYLSDALTCSKPHVGIHLATPGAEVERFWGSGVSEGPPG